jgi:hypothetical protein
VKINTIGFAMSPSAEQGLRLIAEKFHGVFSEVKVPQLTADRQ